MRAILVLLLILPTTGIAALHSQVDYNVRLGLTVATKLLRDVVIQQIEVRQNLAPTLALGASLPISPLYRAGLEATLATSGYHSTEGNGETDLGTLRTGTVALMLNGPIWQRVRWLAGAGIIRYWPTENSGIFLSGGTGRFLAAVGMDYRPPLLAQWGPTVSLRYDFHRFTTNELKARGFSGTEGVQRVSVSIGLGRAGR
jgi:hypothetical protein